MCLVCISVLFKNWIERFLVQLFLVFYKFNGNRHIFLVLFLYKTLVTIKGEREPEAHNSVGFSV